MREIHKHLNLTDIDFNTFVENFQKTLTEMGYDYQLI